MLNLNKLKSSMEFNNAGTAGKSLGHFVQLKKFFKKSQQERFEWEIMMGYRKPKGSRA